MLNVNVKQHRFITVIQLCITSSEYRTVKYKKFHTVVTTRQQEVMNMALKERKYTADPEAEQQQRTNDGDEMEYERQFYRLQLDGGNNAPENSAKSLGPIVVTAIVHIPPYKNSRNRNPLHEIHFFDAEDGSKYKMALDTRSLIERDEKFRPVLDENGNEIPTGQVKKNFPGGLLHYLGTRIDDDEDELQKWTDRYSELTGYDWDPTEHDWNVIGGAFTLNRRFYGIPLEISRIAVKTSKAVMQVFRYKELDKKDYPKIDEFLKEYSEFGFDVPEDRPAKEQKSSEKPVANSGKANTAVTDEMVEAARELLTEDVTIADAARGIKVLFEVSKEVAVAAVDRASAEIASEEADVPGPNEPAVFDGLDEGTIEVLKTEWATGNKSFIKLAKTIENVGDVTRMREEAGKITRAFVKEMKAIEKAEAGE